MCLKLEHTYVSRFGGDEFLLCIQSDRLTELKSFLESVLQLFDSAFVIDDEEVFIGASLGVSLYSTDDQTLEGLISKADIAMYQSKKLNKHHYVYFEASMLNVIREKDEIGKLLKKALRDKSFKLVYQPQIQLDTGKISGLEALIRLKDHPLSALKMIQVAEDTGIINDIGRWVIKETISQIALWREKGIPVSTVAINFSPKQLSDTHIGDFIKDQLAFYNIEPSAIDLEITESILVDDETYAISFLNDLKAIGMQLSLDDFGTGYSSLNYLTKFPVTKIKLDKSFIDNYLNQDQKEIIKQIIQLSASFNLDVLAEGIESHEQYLLLKELGCHYLQGYYFSKPLEVAEIESLLLKEKS